MKKQTKKQSKKEYFMRDDKRKEICGVTVQKIGEEITNLTQKRKGKLHPIDVVKEARDKDHILHNYFVWDNSVAGHKYRLQQARDLIANIVEVVVVEGEQSKQRSFYSVSGNGGGERAYVTLKEAVSTPSYRKELLKKIITQQKNITVLLEMFQDYIK